MILLKYWLEVSPEEQTRRLEARIDDGRKIWKLSPMDLKSYSRWYDYSRARDDMFQATDTAWAPWFVAHSDDKQRARLNIITHLLGHIPYKQVPREKVTAAEAAGSQMATGNQTMPTRSSLKILKACSGHHACRRRQCRTNSIGSGARHPDLAHLDPLRQRSYRPDRARVERRVDDARGSRLRDAPTTSAQTPQQKVVGCAPRSAAAIDRAISNPRVLQRAPASGGKRRSAALRLVATRHKCECSWHSDPIAARISAASWRHRSAVSRGFELNLEKGDPIAISRLLLSKIGAVLARRRQCLRYLPPEYPPGASRAEQAGKSPPPCDRRSSGAHRLPQRHPRRAQGRRL